MCESECVCVCARERARDRDGESGLDVVHASPTEETAENMTGLILLAWKVFYGIPPVFLFV